MDPRKRLSKLSKRTRQNHQASLPLIPHGNAGNTDIIEEPQSSHKENIWKTPSGGWGARSRDGVVKYFKPEDYEFAMAFTQHLADYDKLLTPPPKTMVPEPEPEPDMDFDPNNPMSYAEFPDEPAWPHQESISTQLTDYLPEEIIQERNYKREYALYHSRPDQKKRRAQRNKTRRKLEREGKVKKGDGKDVHHRDRDTSNLSSDNLSVISKSKNRAMKEDKSTSDDAKRRGWISAGWGRWKNKQGQIVAKTVDGKLVILSQNKDTTPKGVAHSFTHLTSPKSQGNPDLKRAKELLTTLPFSHVKMLDRHARDIIQKIRSRNPNRGILKFWLSVLLLAKARVKLGK